MDRPTVTNDFVPQATALLQHGVEPPSVAVILGSGLGDFASTLISARQFTVAEIDGYPKSTVAGHAGAIYFGRVTDGKDTSPPLVVFKGRVHYYESGDLSTAVAPIRLAYALGVRSILITNAAGGIDQSFRPGDLMLIDDVVTLNPSSNSRAIEPPSEPHRPAFDPTLQQLLIDSARETNVPMRRGTYAWVHGPSYETAAEIRMLRAIGAHAVGMSTVPEIAESKRLGQRIAGISLISNMGTGISDTKLTHEEVTATAQEASQRFTALFRHALLRFPE